MFNAWNCFEAAQSYQGKQTDHHSCSARGVRVIPPSTASSTSRCPVQSSAVSLPRERNSYFDQTPALRNWRLFVCCSILIPHDLVLQLSLDQLHLLSEVGGVLGAHLYSQVSTYILRTRGSSCTYRHRYWQGLAILLDSREQYVRLLERLRDLKVHRRQHDRVQNDTQRRVLPHDQAD